MISANDGELRVSQARRNWFTKDRVRRIAVLTSTMQNSLDDGPPAGHGITRHGIVRPTDLVHGQHGLGHPLN